MIFDYKKILIIGTITLVSLFSNKVFADKTVYVQAGSGFICTNTLSVSAMQNLLGATSNYKVTRSKISINLGAGYTLDDRLRFDLSYNALARIKYSSQTNDVISPSVKLNTKSVMLGVNYDFIGYNDNFNPYISSGLGISMIKFNNMLDGSGDSYYKPALGLGFGVSTEIMHNITIDIGYKLHHILAKKVLVPSKEYGKAINMHVFSIGGRFYL